VLALFRLALARVAERDEAPVQCLEKSGSYRELVAQAKK